MAKVRKLSKFINVQHTTTAHRGCSERAKLTNVYTASKYCTAIHPKEFKMLRSRLKYVIATRISCD